LQERSRKKTVSGQLSAFSQNPAAMEGIYVGWAWPAIRLVGRALAAILVFLVAQAFQPVPAQAKACGYIFSRSQAGLGNDILFLKSG